MTNEERNFIADAIEEFSYRCPVSDELAIDGVELIHVLAEYLASDPEFDAEAWKVRATK